MNCFTVSFFGHRRIDRYSELEQALEIVTSKLISENGVVEFLVGRDGEFDQIVSSVIHRYKRTVRSDNSFLVWIMPYMTANYRHNEDFFRMYYDEIEVCQRGENHHFKAAFKLRNQEMVDRSDLVVFYVSHRRGGAFQTLQYAQKQDKPYINLYEGNL